MFTSMQATVGRATGLIMIVAAVLGMVAALSGCQWYEQTNARLRAEQQWRQSHPMEAAQIDLMNAQAYQAQMQGVQNYVNAMNPAPPPRPMPRTGVRSCYTSNHAGLISTTCY